MQTTIISYSSVQPCPVNEVINPAHKQERLSVNNIAFSNSKECIYPSLSQNNMLKTTVEVAKLW